MNDDPNFFARFYEFAVALIPYWWLLVSSGLFAVEPMIEGVIPTKWKTVINKQWPKKLRHKHFRLAAVAALLLSSFFAFDDVNTRSRVLQREVTRLTGEKDQANNALYSTQSATRARAAIKSKIMDYYTEAEPLSRGGGITARSSKEDYKKYEEKISDWKKRTRAWLNKNVSAGAGSRFEDYQAQLSLGQATYTNAIHTEHNWYMNYVGYLRNNLSKMIESDAWDKP